MINVPDVSEMLVEASKNLAQFVASTSFEFWQRKDFRLYVNFPNISQTEQDRMFNELEVSALGLIHLNLRDGVTVGKKGQAEVLKILDREVVESFLGIMHDAGIQKKFLSQWEKLIALRFKEYEGDLVIARKESKKWEELGKDEQIKNSWSRIETITIDCLTHIRRGKVEEKDPLWKLLRQWCITVDTTVSPIIQLAKD